QTVTVVLPDGRRFPASHLYEGVFAATLPVADVPDYRLAVTYPGPGGAGPETISDDPYRHLPTLWEMDLHLVGEGRHEELWQVLGAHVRTFGPAGPAPEAGTQPGEAGGNPPGRPGEAGEPGPAGGPGLSFGSEFGEVTGTSFAVWAPNARGVRIIGDSNHWDGRGHPMRSLGGSVCGSCSCPGSATETGTSSRSAGRTG